MTHYYTFGDEPVACNRLDLLAEVYRPVTEAFLTARVPREPRLAVDLGCGPGHTTRLLHTITGAARTTGLDASARYVAVAGSRSIAGIGFAQADVACAPLPLPPADVLFCRFLLAHLANPARALRIWLDSARPGGTVLVQEMARLSSPVWQLQRYYELVAAALRWHGQSLEIGARLAGVAADAGAGEVCLSRRRLVVSAPVMARLHVLNLRILRTHPAIEALADPEEIDALDAWLDAVVAGRVTAAPVDQELAELVLRRRG